VLDALPQQCHLLLATLALVPLREPVHECLQSLGLAEDLLLVAAQVLHVLSSTGGRLLGVQDSREREGCEQAEGCQGLHLRPLSSSVRSCTSR